MRYLIRRAWWWLEDYWIEVLIGIFLILAWLIACVFPVFLMFREELKK